MKNNRSFIIETSSFIPFLLGLLVLLIALVTLARTPLAWRDEVDLAAIGYSLLHGGSGTPTVLAEDPRWPHSTLFYGPLFFQAGVISFKLFGFSLESWRLVCWLGGVLLAGAAAYLVRVLGASWSWAALCWLLVILSPEFGSTVTNGRMDTLAVGLMLLGLAWFVRGLGHSWGFTLAAGAAWSAAVLTTPRMLTFFFCLAAGALVWLKEARAQWLAVGLRLCVAGAMVLASLCVWLWREGETPLSWWGYLNTVGRFNRQFALAGGAISLRPTPLWLLTLFSAGLLLAAGRVAWRRVVWPQTPLLWVAVTLLGQGIFTVVITSRPESYSVYWGLPLLAVCLACLAAQLPEINRKSWLAACLLLIVVLNGGFRLVKLAEVAATWPARDERKLEEFVRQQVPPGSRVAGPLEFYFYAVERAGSTYRFHEPLNDAYFPFLAERRNPAYDAAMQQKYTANFLLWPAGRPLPASCRCAETDIVAHYIPPAVSGWWGAGGYPATNLYRIR